MSARGGGRIASRQGKLPWVHVGKDGSRIPYATEGDAQAAAAMYGGEAKKNK